MRNIQSATHKVRNPTPNSPVWFQVRIAYEEILLDLPPNFDRLWGTMFQGKQASGEAEANYDIARQACLILALQNRLPVWPSTQPIPEAILELSRNVKKEMRLGLEMNLSLNLTNPQEADLSPEAEIY